jgi:hypothetical protein
MRVTTAALTMTGKSPTVIQSQLTDGTPGRRRRCLALPLWVPVQPGGVEAQVLHVMSFVLGLPAMVQQIAVAAPRRGVGCAVPLLVLLRTVALVVAPVRHQGSDTHQDYIEG